MSKLLNTLEWIIDGFFEQFPAHTPTAMRLQNWIQGWAATISIMADKPLYSALCESLRMMKYDRGRPFEPIIKEEEENVVICGGCKKRYREQGYVYGCSECPFCGYLNWIE